MATEAFDFSAYLADRRLRINQWLSEFTSRRFSTERRLCQAMTYSLMAGGKRLRPILCMASAETLGQSDMQQVMACGCAIEMIHTYSLIHDDLPAMDDDRTRRGQPTCHVKYDEATAILAGDGLLTLAFEVMSELAMETHAGVRAMHQVARAAGYRGMIEGQMRDIRAEGQVLDVDALRRMHLFKTGALIEASVVAGALLGGGASVEIDALSDYARNIGLAFQVADDILNVDGDPELMGKAAGTDLDRKKSTYPALLGLDASRVYARQLINNALQALAVFDNKAKPLEALAGYIIDRRR